MVIGCECDSCMRAPCPHARILVASKMDNLVEQERYKTPTRLDADGRVNAGNLGRRAHVDRLSSDGMRSSKPTTTATLTALGAIESTRNGHVLITFGCPLSASLIILDLMLVIHRSIECMFNEPLDHASIHAPCSLCIGVQWFGLCA